MKKLFTIFCLLFLFTNVKAESFNVDIKWIPNAYYNYKVGNLTYWGQMGYFYVDGNLAYCLELDKHITTDTYYESSEEENVLVVLAGYFGYGYNNEVHFKDYLATQKQIWEYLGYKDVYFTTESEARGEIIDVFDYVRKIVGRINEYAYFPNIGNNYNFDYKSINEIFDSNEILDRFDLLNDTSNNIYTRDNYIVFEANEVGDNNFKLRTKYDPRGFNAIYVANDSQKLMVIGRVDDVTSEYYYNVGASSLNICVIPTDNRKLSKELITQNKISLYKDGNIVGNYTVDENGCLDIKPLENGDYELKLVGISEGYYATNDTYYINLSNNSEFNQYIYIDPIVANLTIIKQYGYKKLDYTRYDSGVKYKLYDANNKLVGEFITDDYGIINTSINYGDYKLVQETTNNINIIHDDIYINKNDFKDNYVFNIYDEIDKIKFNLIPVDLETDNILDNLSFKFNNEDIKVNGNYLSDLIEYGEYIIEDISSDGYKIIDSYYFNIDDSKEFYVVDDVLVTDIYIYFEKIPKEMKVKLIPIDIKTNDVLDNMSISMNGEIINTDGIYLMDILEYKDYEIDSISSNGYDTVYSFRFSIKEDTNFYMLDNILFTDIYVFFNKSIEEEPNTDKEDIINEEISVKEELTDIVMEEKTNDDVEENGINEELNIEKEIIILPNLGVYFEKNNNTYMPNINWM